MKMRGTTLRDRAHTMHAGMPASLGQEQGVARMGGGESRLI